MRNVPWRKLTFPELGFVCVGGGRIQVQDEVRHEEDHVCQGGAQRAE